jgi:hypothetical protein
MLGVMTATATAEERRIALIMGNSAYKQTPLANSASDARLMASRLRSQQFTVFDHYDAGQKDMKRAVQAFSQKIQEAGGDAVVFIYYAGHGVQVKGENYLIPVDANIHTEGDIDIDAVSVSSVMSMLDSTHPRLSVVVLDACRTNPFGYSRSADRGLARVDAPSGSLVAFSTAPGRAAKDGDGGNSPYTAALAQTLGEPGLKIEEVFKKVRVAVQAATNGEQVPWETTSLTGDFYPAGPLKDHEQTALATPTDNPAAKLNRHMTISGTWTGEYSFPETYPGRPQPVPFTFVFSSSGCQGRSDEINTFGQLNAPRLFANLACSASALSPGQTITIKKTYDGTGGVSHSVVYSGTVSPDMRAISGKWTIGGQSGPFTMRR